MIWLVIIVMVSIALVIILMPLLRAKSTAIENRSQQNIDIAQEQLRNLKEAMKQGDISEQEFDVAREDVEKTLHSDLVDQTNSSSIDSGTDYKTSGILILALPVFVIAIYYSLGSPLLVGISAQPESTVLLPAIQTSTSSEPVNDDRTVFEKFQKRFDQKPEPAGQVGDVRSMFEKLQKRLELNPDDAQGWMMMGLTYMHFEQFDEAVNAYQKAAALLPDDADAQQALNRAVEAQSGNVEDKSTTDTIEKKMVAPNGQTVDVGAMVMGLRSKLEANPDNPQGWLLLGRSYTNLGRHADAVGAYQQALKLMPNDPDVEIMLNEAKNNVNQPK